MNMKKRLISAALSAVMVLGTAVFAGAEDTAELSPRATVVLENGYIRGFGEIPTADFVAAQFDGAVTVSTPDNKDITGDTPVPADSAVISNSEIIAFVEVAGDSNRDGNVNVADVTAMLKYIAKWNIVISAGSSDVTGDGAVNVSDVTMLLKYIAKWNVDIFFECPIAVSDGSYILLENDGETDAAFLAALKEDCGVELQSFSAASGEDNYVVVGENLPELFSFIDKEAAAAEVADGKAYIDTYGGDVYIVTSADGIDFVTTELAQQIADGEIIIPRGYYGPMTLMTERSTLYWNAVENLLANEPVVGQDVNGMSEDLAVAIANAPYTAPKNIIYMIGDGMGKNVAIATKYARADDLYNGELAMNYLPTEGRQSTYSANDQVTDSAAGGTALATGFKTSNGTIAMDVEYAQSYKTLLELASEQGKSTGIIATKSVTDATPAAFTAHVNTRDEQVKIANQQLQKLTDGTLDIILGGGAQYYNDSEKKNESAIAAAEAAGVTYTNDWDTVVNAEMPIAGIFAPAELTTYVGSGDPHIAEMTDLALDKLSSDGNENGFFIMIEGSQIDSWCHLNYFEDATDETYEFDCAIAVAMRYVALNPDTVLVVTADHETGGLMLSHNPPPNSDNISGSSRFTSTGHTWIDVPVYAAGYNTETLGGNQENTDVAIFLAGLMSDEQFGQTSKVVTLADLTDSKTANAVVAHNNNSEFVRKTDKGVSVLLAKKDGIETFSVPNSVFNISDEDRASVTAIRVTFTNVGTTPARLPTFGVVDSNGKTYTRDRQELLWQGDTVNFTFNLEALWRRTDSMTLTEEFSLFVPSGYEPTTLNISKIEAVVRPLDK